MGAYQWASEASPSSIRTRSPTPAVAARSRAKATSAGSSSTSSAETSSRRGCSATTSITSRPCPAHRLTMRIGGPAGASSSTRRTMACTVRSRSDRFDAGSS